MLHLLSFSRLVETARPAYASDWAAGSDTVPSLRRAAASLYSSRLLAMNETHHQAGVVTLTGWSHFSDGDNAAPIAERKGLSLCAADVLR